VPLSFNKLPAGRALLKLVSIASFNAKRWLFNVRSQAWKRFHQRDGIDLGTSIGPLHGELLGQAAVVDMVVARNAVA
jgi:hypothetical protein